MTAAVERPAAVRLRIGKIEDGLIDRPIRGRLRGGIGGEITGDPHLAAPGRGDMRDDEGDQDQGPQHDQQRKSAMTPWHAPPGRYYRHRLTAGSGWPARRGAALAGVAAPDRR